MRGYRLLLTGVVVNAILSSLILLLNHLAPPARRLLVLTWMTGNLGAVPVGWVEISTVAAGSCLGLGAFSESKLDGDHQHRALQPRA